MNKITEPLQLAVGSHEAGTGQGCAMNVVSWINGDATITDYPACSDTLLARIVQGVNDTLCAHRDGDLLCPPCSTIAVDLGLATIGTGATGLTDLDLRRVYVRIAVDQAEQVLHLIETPTRQRQARTMLDATLAWADDPSEENIEALRRVRTTADAAYTSAAAASHTYTYTSAAYTSAAAASHTYTYTYTSAASAASHAASADDAKRVELAWRAIRLFKDLTATNTPTIGAPVVKAALDNMCAVPENVTR